MFVCSGDERFSVDSLPRPSVRTFKTLVLATNVTTNERVDGIRRHYCESAAVFDFRKRMGQTNFQTAGVSVDALTSQIQSCGLGDSSGPWSAGSTDRRIVVFPLTRRSRNQKG
jgi:hypothetical protein